jgi:phenylacetate-CoA ligase
VRGTIFDAVIGKALMLRHCLWHPYDFAAKFASIRRVHGGTYDYPHGLHLERWGDSATFPFATGPSSILSIGASIAQQAEWLLREDPDYLMTFPSNVRFLAAHCRERGIVFPHLGRDNVGEVLSAETREECRRAWDLSVIDVYSAQEVGIIALQCPAREHYHVQAETMFVEVVDERGEPCGPGQTGRVLVTPLNNYAMPLLRYEIGDWAEPGGPCPCGRGLPVLSRILGRERNALLVAPTGERYWPAFGTRKLPELAPIVQHQFVQKSLQRIEARWSPRARSRGGKQASRHRREPALSIQARLRRFMSSRETTGKFEDFLRKTDGQGEDRVTLPPVTSPSPRRRRLPLASLRRWPRDPATGESCAVPRAVASSGCSARRDPRGTRTQDGLTAAIRGAFPHPDLGATDSPFGHVLAASRPGIGPGVTVLDLCETPLALNRWYWSVWHTRSRSATDIFEYEVERPFDIICTHPCLGRRDQKQRGRVVDKWRELLFVGGTVVTANRIQPAATAEPKAFSPEQARAFRDAVSCGAESLHLSTSIDPREIVRQADLYTTHQIVYPVRSREEFVGLFEQSGFTVGHISWSPIASGARSDVSGPGVPGTSEYGRIIAIRS